MVDLHTYAQDLSRHALIGLEAGGGDLELAADLVHEYGEPHLRHGIAAFREAMARLYADMAQRPDEYGIPDVIATAVADSRQRRRVRKPFEAAPNLLYTLGVLGELRPDREAYDLEVDAAALETRCADLGIDTAAQLLSRLSHVGLQVLTHGGSPGGVRMTARSCASPHAPLALKLFADLSQLYVTKRSRKQKDFARPPDVFYRADLRILQHTDRTVRLPRHTVADIHPYLPDAQAADLARLSERAESLGYRARIRCTDVLGGAWRSSYISREHGRTLFGFGFDHSGLNLRLNCGDTRRALPYIEKCPPGLRNELLRGGCARCGGKGCGKHVAVTVDGEEREICHFGIFSVRQWTDEDVESLLWLLVEQARLYAS